MENPTDCDWIDGGRQVKTPLTRSLSLSLSLLFLLSDEAPHSFVSSGELAGWTFHPFAVHDGRSIALRSHVWERAGGVWRDRGVHWKLQGECLHHWHSKYIRFFISSAVFLLGVFLESHQSPESLLWDSGSSQEGWRCLHAEDKGTNATALNRLTGVSWYICSNIVFNTSYTGWEGWGEVRLREMAQTCNSTWAESLTLLTLFFSVTDHQEVTPTVQDHLKSKTKQVLKTRHRSESVQRLSTFIYM